MIVHSNAFVFSTNLLGVVSRYGYNLENVKMVYYPSSTCIIIIRIMIIIHIYYVFVIIAIYVSAINKQLHNYL